MVTTVKGVIFAGLNFRVFPSADHFEGLNFEVWACEQSQLVTFTCQTDDCHASEVAEESEGGREKTSVVKLVVFMMLLHQLILFYCSTYGDIVGHGH